MTEKDRRKEIKKDLQIENRKILTDLKPLIAELEKNGIKHNDYYTEGLGDIVEASLNKLGITEERFKRLFNLRECQCNQRKKWLNSVLYWHRENK